MRQQKNVHHGSDKPALTACNITSHNDGLGKNNAFKTPPVAKQ